MVPIPSLQCKFITLIKLNALALLTGILVGKHSLFSSSQFKLGKQNQDVNVNYDATSVF